MVEVAALIHPSSIHLLHFIYLFFAFLECLFFKHDNIVILMNKLIRENDSGIKLRNIGRKGKENN